MNLNQIRFFVRTQLDLDETDLPDVLLDAYVQDGYDHIINLERRWPFFETLWDQIIVPAGGVFTLPVDVDVIESMMTYSGQRLWHVDMRWAEDNVGLGAAGTPGYWGRVNRQVRLWPKPSSELTLRARGFRLPSAWIAAGASSEVDADVRLHLPICWYCCSVGYAQQEDEVLEATYMNRYREAVTLAHDAVMRPTRGNPKILNGMRYPTGPLCVSASGSDHPDRHVNAEPVAATQPVRLHRRHQPATGNGAAVGERAARAVQPGSRPARWAQRAQRVASGQHDTGHRHHLEPAQRLRPHQGER